MSRAFMRDPEPGEPRCPSCGALGEPVGARTLEAQIPAAARAALGAAAFYCENPACRIAYFTAWGASVPDGPLNSPAYPKNPEAPVCPCFGIPAGEVLADAREGRKDRMKDLVERSKGPEARCIERCPDGKSCMPRVMRLFREAFEAR
jgi:hypothetical protein